MVEKWFVVTISKNIEGGVSSSIVNKDSEKDAMSLFYYNCDKTGTNPATAVCIVMVINPYGDIAKVEKIDNTKYDAAE